MGFGLLVMGFGLLVVGFGLAMKFGQGMKPKVVPESGDRD
jgi:hypothetical protein